MESGSCGYKAMIVPAPSMRATLLPGGTAICCICRPIQARSRDRNTTEVTAPLSSSTGSASTMMFIPVVRPTTKPQTTNLRVVRQTCQGRVGELDEFPEHGRLEPGDALGLMLGLLQMRLPIFVRCPRNQAEGRQYGEKHQQEETQPQTGPPRGGGMARRLRVRRCRIGWTIGGAFSGKIFGNGAHMHPRPRAFTW